MAAADVLDVSDDITTIAEVLCDCLSGGGGIGPFIAAFRDSSLLDLPLRHPRDLRTAHRLCSQVLHAIGRHSIGAAYAIENHYFILAAAATYQALHPTSDVEQFLARVASSRLLVANTRAAVHTDVTLSDGARATIRPEGYCIDGNAGFVSLATFADVLWLQIELAAAQRAIFIVDLKDRTSLRFGGLSFPAVMIESETRSISFDELILPEEARIHVPEIELWPQGKLTAALALWHDSLIAAQFLGGAAGALEELVSFVKEMKAWGGKPFWQLDNVLAELGRLGVRYTAAAAMLERVTAVVGELDGPGPQSEWRTRALFTAKAANLHVTTAAEEVVTGCRRLVGTRVFRGGRLERLSTEAMIGPLVPRGNPLLELEFGRYVVDHLPTLLDGAAKHGATGAPRVRGAHPDAPVEFAG